MRPNLSQKSDSADFLNAAPKLHGLERTDYVLWNI